MQMKYNRDGVYEKLYPKTLSGNVMMNDGNTVEQWKTEVNDRMNSLEDAHDNLELWNGSLSMDTNETVTPSKKLSECVTGWLLVFAKASDSGGAYSNYSYQYVPKVHLKATTPSTGWIKFILGNSNGRIISKYLLAQDATIRGHSVNITTDNDTVGVKLLKVYEY